MKRNYINFKRKLFVLSSTLCLIGIVDAQAQCPENVQLDGIRTLCQEHTSGDNGRTILASVSVGVANFEWYKNNEFVTDQSNMDISEIATYKCIANVDGCDPVQEEFDVNYATVPTFTIDGDMDICAGATTKLTASANSSSPWYITKYYWGDIESNILDVTEAGTYTLKAVSNEGCIFYHDASVGYISGTGSYTSENVCVGSNLTIVDNFDLEQTGNSGVTYQIFNNYLTRESDKISDNLTLLNLQESVEYFIVKTQNGCEDKQAFTPNVIPIPDAPTWLASEPICGEGSIDFYELTRKSSDSPFKIYATETSETSIGDGLTTPMIGETTDFWISNSNGTCESERVKYTAIVNQVSNEYFEPVSICGAGDITFVPSANVRLNVPNNVSYAIYASPIMGNKVSDNLTLTNVQESGNYYIVKTENGCNSEEIQVSAIVNEVPVFNVTTSGSFITANVNPNDDITNYKLLNCNSAFELSSNINTIRVPNSSNYKIEITAYNGCSAISECIDVNIIAGDINGNGIIENDHIADITRIKTPVLNEIAGDIDLDGIINGSEIIGDLSGNYVIDGDEIEGDYNGNFRLDASENTITSVSVNKLASFTTYPNPASDVINVSFPSETSGNVSIVNANGIEVSNQSINGSLVSINTSSLTSGVYVLKVNSNNSFATQQIVIAK